MMPNSNLHDERIVSRVIEAIAGRQISLVVQGIHSADDTDHILYGECLARMTDKDGTVHAAAEFIPAMELLGASPLLDRHILALVLDALESDPYAILGCNISADNLLSETDWFGVIHQIRSRKKLADRLVLEVTETNPLQDIKVAAQLLDEARELGCRVAIDDFGTGHWTPEALTEIEPDIVKIDSVFAERATRNARGRRFLERLTALASTCGAITVIEGIITKQHLDQAWWANPGYLQGFFLSRPVSI
ncbi:EAL domain-containing protein [Brucella cytisi]|uniref:EAL domain-containing protein n=1 Tax=Brucella cytisi TaxID=407152 RepID=UPI0035DA2027